MNKIISILVIFLLFSVLVNAQSIKELEAEKRKNLEEIKYTNKLLEEARKSSKKSYQELLIINRKIQLRNRLINNIYSEISYLTQKVEESEDSLKVLQANLKKIKNEYAKLIYFAYKNKSEYDRLLFILSSNDFNQAYRRMKYLQQYAKYRRQKAEELVSIQKEIDKKIIRLEKRKQEQFALIKEKEEEAKTLASEKSKQGDVLAELKKQEKKLRAKLKEKEKATRKIQKMIEDIIAEEARKAAEAARKAGKSPSKKYALTPEDKLISDNFGKNKGRLPWPVERGVVISSFGKHKHPVLKDIWIENNGIDIATGQGEPARSVFKGVVSRVFSIPGKNMAVIIRHGNYLSVYTNLIDVAVKSGDTVEAKQILGKVYTDTSDSKTVVHIEIWQSNKKMNPLLWLSGK